MKTTLIILSSLFLFIACEKQNSKKLVSYEKVSPAGCNLGIDYEARSSKTSLNAGQNDTVYSYMKNDTIHFFVGLNYVCCAPFIAQAEADDNQLTMTISDTCSSAASCYCKCMCYYTWDFEFAKNGANNYSFIINLESPMDGESRPLLEGEFQYK